VLRALLAGGDLDLPHPGGGRTAMRWAALAAWGRRDLTLARLAEGHCDAVAILAECGRLPVGGMLYGVWAARSGGSPPRLHRRAGGLVMTGTARFCSGATSLDRALVVADQPGDATGGPLLVEVALPNGGVRPRPETWQTVAMDSADTQDVEFDDVEVAPTDVVGDPGWYMGRPGFAIGGGGVAAVWWGGAVGVVDRVMSHLPDAPDPHQLAHLGELHALLEAADALLGRTAAVIDDAPGVDHRLAVAAVRSAVEHSARAVIDRGPRMVGPAPLSRDGGLARAVADLQLYLRQHHGERDHATVAELVLARRRNR